MRTAAKKKEIFQHRRAERNVNMLLAVIVQLQNGAGREKIPARFNLCYIETDKHGKQKNWLAHARFT